MAKQTEKQLLEARMTAFNAMKATIDAASKDDRQLTADEAKSVDASQGEIDRLTAEIEAMRADEVRYARVKEIETQLAAPAPKRDLGPPSKTPGELLAERRLEAGDDAPITATPEYRKGFARFLYNPATNMPYTRFDGIEGRDKSGAKLAIQTDNDVRAGFVVASEEWMLELVKNVDDIVDIRRMARKIPVRGAVSLKFPRQTAKVASAAWGEELTPPTDDTAWRVGQGKLEPHYVTGEVDVSRDWLRLSVLPADALIRGEIARDVAELEENAFLTANGSQRPMGLFTAASGDTLGITTGRDMSTDNTTTAITADGLMNNLYNLKSTYQRAATWLFHRTAVRNIRKLKTGDGQYIWQPGLQAGQPDLILGRPLVMSEFAPSTFTTGLYVGLIGDFSWYWIVDQLDLEILVLTELLARTNQIGYVYRIKVDAAPIKEEAFSRVTLA